MSSSTPRASSHSASDFSEIEHPLPARLTTLLEATCHDGPELGLGHAEIGDRYRRLLDDAPQERIVVLGDEGHLAGHQLIKDDRERPDVAARVDVEVAARLLGRHVRRAAEHHAFPRHVGRDWGETLRSSLAMPKSSTLGCRRPPASREMKMLSGLRSRWTIPARVRGRERIHDGQKGLHGPHRAYFAAPPEQIGPGFRRAAAPWR